MALATETVELRYEDVVAGVEISVAIPAFSVEDVYVYYGFAGLLAVQNVDYTVELQPSQYDTFNVTPLPSLIAKIDALILADITEVNYITVRRTLDYKTVTTTGVARDPSFISREFDRAAMRDAQLAEGLRRAIKQGPQVANAPEVFVSEFLEDHMLMYSGGAIVPGPSSDEIDNAQAYAEAAAASAAAAGTGFALTGEDGQVLFSKPFPAPAEWRWPLPSDFMEINETMVGKLVRISSDLDFEIVELVDQVETLNYNLFTPGTGIYYNSSALATGAWSADLDWTVNRVRLDNGKIAEMHINATYGYAAVRAYNGTSWTALRELTGDNVPWNSPATGEYARTTTGAGGATAAQAGVANNCDMYPWIPRKTVSGDRLSLNCTVGVAAALAKIVVYSANIQGKPDVLLFESATLDLATSGIKEAVANLTFQQGVTYWIGVRHSSTATISVWPATATPDLNGPTLSVNARKVVRRSLVFADAAPTAWAYVGSEVVDAASLAAAPALFVRSL